MKIAYVLYPDAIVSGRSNGIRNQALKWSEALDGLAPVDLVSPWDNVRWETYQAAHLFGGTQWLGFVPDLRKVIDNVVFSPILDSIDSKKKLRFMANLSVKGYHHPFNMYKRYLNSFKKILVRSDYEAEYMTYCFGVPESKISKVAIAHEMDTTKLAAAEKEDFCLHVSAVYQERKNVRRLVEASKKYGFRLVLAGNPGNPEQKAEVERWIGDCNWIELRGFMPEDELRNLYARAKVFALPSINEGVGIVALNAAVAGCDIVLTNIGGPKEYYDGMARLVNPYNVDEIGKAIVDAMKYPVNPQLKNHIIKNYSTPAIGRSLFDFYKSL